MTGLKTHLGEVLTAAVKGRGFAGASVIRWPGAEPCSVWLPESSYEPAFLAYSITKTFTATLILQLCDEGTLDLDTPVARWFPRLPDAERISIRRLLNHTAGLPDYGPIRAYHEAVRSSPTEPWSFDRFAAETFEKGLLFRPRLGWAYSKPAYMLAKRIAEEVTGLSYRDLVSERLARPLGLKRTFVPESLGDLAPLARGATVLSSGVGVARSGGIYAVRDRALHGRTVSWRSPAAPDARPDAGAYTTLDGIRTGCVCTGFPPASRDPELWTWAHG
jgi:D-alanyl-D-alanine carboxypeptidase